MYWEHFKLRARPFENISDPEFFFMSTQYREALTAMLYGIEVGKGLMAIIGPAGCGKTYLSQLMLGRLPETNLTMNLVCIKNRAMDLLASIGRELGVESGGEGYLSLTEGIVHELKELDRDGGRFVLVLDEAQALSRKSLEEVQYLSNLENGQNKLVQILLLGRGGLLNTLNRPDMAPLRQRMAVIRKLRPLTPGLTDQYIRHRLETAGAAPGLFTDQALAAIGRFSKGVPRVINQLGDAALVIAYESGAAQVDLEPALRAARELELEMPSNPAADQEAFNIRDEGQSALDFSGLDPPEASAEMTGLPAKNPHPPPLEADSDEAFAQPLQACRKKPHVVAITLMILMTAILMALPRTWLGAARIPDDRQVLKPAPSSVEVRTVPEAKPVFLTTDFSLRDHPLPPGPAVGPAFAWLPPAEAPGTAVSVEANESPAPSYPYSLQVATFYSRSSAEKCLDHYRSQGQLAYWSRHSDAEGNPVYCIYVGFFRDFDEAEQTMKALGYDKSIVRKMPYAVLVGRDGSQNKLESDASALRDQGYSAYVIPSAGEKYLLLVGSYKDLDSAEKQTADLSAAGIKGRVVQR